MKSSVVLAVFALVGAAAMLCGFAFEDPPAAPSNGQSFGGINFTTYAGIALFVTMAIGFSKKLWKDWVKGKEIYLAYGLAIAAGVAAKALGAFGGLHSGAESWVNHVIALIGTGAGSGIIHDKIINPLKDKTPK
jgi:hypothetical protein